MAQMVLGEPSSTKFVQIILVNLKHGCQRAEFVLLYIYRENLKNPSCPILALAEYNLAQLDLACPSPKIVQMFLID